MVYAVENLNKVLWDLVEIWPVNTLQNEKHMLQIIEQLPNMVKKWKIFKSHCGLYKSCIALHLFRYCKIQLKHDFSIFCKKDMIMG